MSIEFDQSVIETVRRAGTRALDWLIPSDDCRFELTDIVLSAHPSPTSESQEWMLSVRVATNNRALVLGQFADLSPDGFRGFHDNYVIGFVHSAVLAEHGLELGRLVQLQLDVHESPSARPSDAYRYLPLSEALARGALTDASPLARRMRRYELAHLLVAGYAVSGPSPGMIDAIEEFCRDHAGVTVIDAFSGTGSLARVALVAGAARVSCVDQSVGHEAHGTLADFPGRSEFLSADAFDASFEWPEADLIVADPFYDHTYLVTRNLLPRWRGSVSTVIVNLGPSSAMAWQERNTCAIREAGFSVETRDAFGEAIAWCTVR